MRGEYSPRFSFLPVACLAMRSARPLFRADSVLRKKFKIRFVDQIKQAGLGFVEEAIFSAFCFGINVVC